MLLFVMLLALDEVFKSVNENGEVEYHFLKNYQRQRLFVFISPLMSMRELEESLEKLPVKVESIIRVVDY